MNAGAILAFGALASTAILFVAVTIVIRAARAVNSRVMWVIAVTLTVVVLLVSPLCVETLIRLFNRRVDATFVMIDPGWTIKILPGVAAVSLACAIHLVTRNRTGRRSAK